MSITVIIARDDAGAPTTREIYATGAKFINDDGNLNIVSANQVLATYGSGNWLSVHMDDSVEVITTKSEEDSDDSDDTDFSFGDDSDSDDTDFSFGDDSSADDDSSDDDSSGEDTASGEDEPASESDDEETASE
jgi:hypothetical protein